MNAQLIFPTISFGLSALIVKVLSVKFQRKLLDIPNERSAHSKPVPRGGGIGFILSFYATLGCLIGVQGFIPLSVGVLVSLMPLVIIGFLDDWKNLSAAVRYGIQLSVSTATVFLLGPFPVTNMDQSDSSVLYFGAIALTIVGMTALINFYNFMDGLDGLIATTSSVQLSFLAIWTGNSALWILVAAILGFLVWNWHPAKIFMGDSGSTFLGAVIAIAILSKQSNPSDTWAILTLTLPITLDTTYTLIRRLIQGENIFQAHRSHLYQRLHQSGWSHPQVCSLYAGASLFSGVTLLTLGASAIWINLIGAGICLGASEYYLSQRPLPASK